MTTSRIFLFLLLFFIAGVSVRSFVFVPYFLLLFLCVIAGILLVRGSAGGKKNWVVVGLCVVFFAGGIFRFDRVSNVLTNPLLFDGHRFRGIIYEDPERHMQSQKFSVSVHEVDGNVLKKSVNILLTARKYPEYALGDEIIFSGTVEKPENFSDFDYVSYLKGKNIFATASFPLVEKVGDGKGNPLRLFLSRIKFRLEEKIDILFPEPYGAFLRGLLLGERALLPADFLDALKETGTTHIVALSGYNITLVGAFALSILLSLTIPFRMAFWMACSFIVLFVMLTGASASVVRAGIMGILVLVAQNEGRTYRMTNALVFAAAVMIGNNPFILRFDAGFQLSFLATCGILYLPQRLEPYIQRIRRILRKKRDVLGQREHARSVALPMQKIFIETLSAQIFVLPHLVFLFGKISLVSPLVNILVLPFIPYAMSIGFLASVFGFFFLPLARMVAWGAWFFLFYIIMTIEWFSRVPFASVSVNFVPWYFLAVGYTLLIVWIQFAKTEK